MAPPTPESLAGMGLLGKRDSIKTEVLSLRDDVKRLAYYNRFTTANGSVDDLANVRWCTDNTPSTCLSRCNGNIVLLEIGAKIPASEDGNRPENTIPPIIRYPKTALAAWGLEYLTVSHTTYKGMDRILISEPSKMPVPRYFEYLPKKIHDTKIAECTSFVTEKVSTNPGLELKYVTIKFILMRCNVPLEHRGDVEDHTWFLSPLDMRGMSAEVYQQ